MTSETPESQSTLVLYATDTNGATVQLEAIKSRRYQERFWTMFTTTTARVAGFDRPPAYFRALMVCLTELDPIQFRRISAREIATAAKMSAISAERALTMLESDGVIIANGGQTGAKARRLNNTLAWASKAEHHRATTPDPEIIDTRGR